MCILFAPFVRPCQKYFCFQRSNKRLYFESIVTIVGAPLAVFRQEEENRRHRQFALARLGSCSVVIFQVFFYTAARCTIGALLLYAI